MKITQALTHTSTLNNALGITAVAGVLNELCEEGNIWLAIRRDLRHLFGRSCWLEIKKKKKRTISWCHMTYGEMAFSKAAPKAKATGEGF